MVEKPGSDIPQPTVHMVIINLWVKCLPSLIMVFITKGFSINSSDIYQFIYYLNPINNMKNLGTIFATGQVKIIDRKKDLVKLQLGEYISLGKVESELKTCPIVENVCIYGDPTQNYVVALIVPDKVKLETLAERIGVTGLEHEKLCTHKDVTGAVLRELQHHGRRLGLEKFELPGELIFSS